MTLRREDALQYHREGGAGKIEISPTKPLTTIRDLSLAYSPGVASPCLAIAAEPGLVYDFTASGNIFAVISNGAAVLGLGNIGAEAGKPVMEGKAELSGDGRRRGGHLPGAARAPPHPGRVRDRSGRRAGAARRLRRSTATCSRTSPCAPI